MMINQIRNYFKINSFKRKLIRIMKQTDEKPVWQKKYITNSNEIIIYKSDTPISNKEFNQLIEITEEELYNGCDYRELAMFLTRRVFNAERTINIIILEDHVTILIVNMFLNLYQ